MTDTNPRHWMTGTKRDKTEGQYSRVGAKNRLRLGVIVAWALTRGRTALELREEEKEEK